MDLRYIMEVKVTELIFRYDVKITRGIQYDFWISRIDIIYLERSSGGRKKGLGEIFFKVCFRN